MGNAIDTSRIKEVEARIKSSEAMIQSMNKKERSNPELLIKDKTARSRLIRITKGAGLKFEEGLQFVGEFQKMRTMMSRMQKQMGVGGMFPGDPALASPAALGEASVAAGNRQARRAAKKKVKSGRGGGGGFGR
jgi:signal recognition particle subunit SRP54